jgi:hypothetical protein
MKKLFGVLFSLLIIYSIYFDLTVGTLPHIGSEKAEAIIKTDSALPYFEAKVRPGETLITIVENQANKSISIPITDLISNFKSLNPGQAPEKIQIGKIYKFPKYSK